MAEAVKEHFAKTLSAEALTATLRDRLGKKRERATVHEELTRLENELAVIGEINDARIVTLKQKVQELQKKVRSRPTGPSP